MQAGVGAPSLYMCGQVLVGQEQGLVGIEKAERRWPEGRRVYLNYLRRVHGCHPIVDNPVHVDLFEGRGLVAVVY